MLEYTLKCHQIYKKLGDVQAIHDVTVDFEPNAIHGLLGPSGAGKTTLLHLISGQLFPDQGSVTAGHYPIHENPLIVSNICLVKAEERSWSQYKVGDIMKFCSLLYPAWDAKLAAELLHQFRIPPNQRFKQLSRGNQSLLGIVKGLASRSPITLFDEPTLGLDAEKREAFYELLLRDYSEHPRTLILSTHLIDESADLLQFITLLQQGTVTAHKNAEEFADQARYLQGSTKQLEPFFGDARVLNRESLGHVTRIAWLGSLDNEPSLREQGIDISPIPLQKLFVYLTRQEHRTSEVNVHESVS
ncbi:ABC transporter ATP-binding protein [Paenibacillus lentus]|uniref:ABC transporter ATP-binding protein n=1 Tax=Paenibacillus lentus TaxID=1338368 RepID=A0A3S8RTJ3_9BACL|nr:ABC transporter ATP-binding protein [Paenibacillus lentus]AZK46289.1 ABC transporter ATP-binding protein [Paenibacillus lentus]